jgi:hypothetical protein
MRPASIRLFALAASGVATFALAAFAAELPDAAKSLRSAYQKNLTAIRDQFLARKIVAMSQCTNAVALAAETCQKGGDLDGLLALAEERKRMAVAGVVPETDAPNMHPAVARIRAAYRTAVAAARRDCDAAEDSLVTRHIQDLDAMKRNLTIQGKMEDAIAVRDYLVPLASAMKKSVAPQESSTPPDEQRLDCPVCDGAGKRMTACTKCSGTAQCASCDGTGMRKPSMKGGSPTPCLTCKRSGRCAACAGKGSVPDSPCDPCGGVGKLSKANADAVEAGRSKPLPPKDRVWIYRLRSLDANTALTMAARMKDDVEWGNVVTMDLDKALQNASSVRGKACRSKAVFRWGGGHQLTVSVRPGVDFAVGLMPYSRGDAGALAGTLATLKRDDPIVITYGIVEPDCLVLFRVAPFP